jgi:membrane protease YdiL (CAAX protease family)
MLEALVFVTGLWGILRLHGTDEPLRHQLGLRSTHGGLAVLGLLLGLSLHFPAESLRQIIEARYPTPSEDLAQRAALLDGSTPLRAAMVLIVVGCVGPLVEELFFRGALYGTLRRSHAIVGSTVATAAAFVVTHLDPRMWLPLTVVSATLGYLRAASGSTLPGLALHVAFNTVTVVAVASGVSSVTAPEDVAASVLVPGWLATAVLLMGVAWLARSAEAAEARSLDGR